MYFIIWASSVGIGNFLSTVEKCSLDLCTNSFFNSVDLEHVN